TQLIGVQKKILSQINALRKNGNVVDVAYCSDGKFIIESVDETISIDVKKGFTNYRYSIYKYLSKNIKKLNYKQIYVRYPGSIEYYFYKTLKDLKKRGVDVYLELPTYPIGGELVNFLKSLIGDKKYIEFTLRLNIYIVHRILSRKIYKYIKKIVTFMPHDKVWGCDTVCIDNGINIEDFKLNVKKKYSNNKIVLLGVANVAKWHGFDRVIEGLGEYYKDKQELEVEFRIVGDSDLIDTLKSRVNELGISDKVEFLGIKRGNELENEYYNCDIGVSSLGMHRIGIKNGSTLKTKEYCGYGIPFIMAYKEKEINDNFKYCLNIDADESPVDIKDVVRFYNSLKKYNNIAKELNNFARDKYDWKKQMEKIFL
ncbi:glycosyltransferase, partial [Clostridium perfringens]